jgi:hypothetical protein
MKCRNAEKLIFDFIDGLENDTQRLELEKHLAQCAECDKLASQLARSMDLLHRAPRETTSDNFAWKVRLKLNQEKNAIQERSESYGPLIRSWNLKYTATAVAAAAAVLVVGLFAVKSGLLPTTPGIQSPDTYAEGGSAAGETKSTVDTFGGRADEDVATRSTGPGSGSPPSGRPELSISMHNKWTNLGMASLGASPEGTSSQMLGLIDRKAPMTVAELDSIVNVELNGLTTEEKRQYLSQYIILLQRHLLSTGVVYRQNRR